MAAAGIAAAGSIGSGIIGGNAAQSAANAQAGAANNATNAELGMYNQTVAREQPFVTAGQNALAQLQQLLGLTGGSGGAGGAPSSPILQMLGLGPNGVTGSGIDPRTFQGSPGYQYQVQQGENAVTNSNARGGLGGNALRQLQQTGQGLANQNWSQYLGNVGAAWQQLLGNISGVVAGGQNAANNLGTTATTVGGQLGSNAIGVGNALAGGIMGGANATAGGINGAINSITPFLLNQQGGGGVGFLNGIGNIFSGNQWDGMAGGSNLSGLTSQANNYAAGGAAGI